MTMSAADVVIRAVDVTKVYRLYVKPSYRFRDMFGLLGNRPGAYTEHAALNGVNLEIRRGEKVAIIGRNGAGKSTFLKLVTSVIQPTSGRLEVNAHVHALLQIGTGFHPDFTGRENVYAYFAQLGITGRDADRRCVEVVEFAELEEYIDQPVKTYSTGMAVRLMFATSTAIAPDLLVLDEVLGVGDAYFSQKSFSRMQELCERHGTTLLLVTHDIYSAAKLCQRVVWIDRGKVVIDGDPTRVLKAYSESIRLQEESRLRLKRQAGLERKDDRRAVAAAPIYLMLEIQARGGRPQRSSVHFSRIALMNGGDQVAQLPLDDTAFDDPKGSHLVREDGCWGPVETCHDRRARPMVNYGSSFHKAVGVMAVPADAANALDHATLVMEYWSAEACDLVLTAYEEGRAIALGDLTTAPGSWTIHTTPFNRAGLAEPQVNVVVEAVGLQGAGDIVITRFTMLDASGAETHTVEHGAPVSFRTDFAIRRSDLRERAQVFIIITRNHTEPVCKFKTSELLFDHASQPAGVVDMRLPKMMLGAGTYSVAVEIAAEGYIEQGLTKFFSIDPSVYYCITHALEFTVLDSGWIGPGTIFEGEGTWAMRNMVAE